jgi:hypothetical protein
MDLASDSRVYWGTFAGNTSITSKTKEQKNGRNNNNSIGCWDPFHYRTWCYYLATAPEGN